MIKPEAPVYSEEETLRVKTANNYKLGFWVNEVINADTNTVLMDSDIIVLKDMADVFEHDFDVAITVRPGSCWINGGVVFVKPTEEARAIMKKWKKYDDMLCKDNELYNHSVRANGSKGMNQVSFVHGYEELKKCGKIIELPCHIWNSGNTSWPLYTEETRVIHVKGSLRRHIISGHSLPATATKVYAAIKGYYGNK